MSVIRFTKMVGTGNDFAIVDVRHQRLMPRRGQWSAISRALCDRHRGVGADGLLVLEPSTRADIKMRIVNADGSEAEMCGNGARCVAVLLAGADARRRLVTIETMAGVLSATVSGDRVALHMTDPTDLKLGRSLSIGRHRFQAGCVNTGVPHLVVPVAGLEQIDVPQLGRALRFHRQFAPHGTNVNFVQADATRSNRLRIRTYERGVEAETLACGTGVTAAALLHVLNRAPHRGSSHAHVNGQAQHYRVEVTTRSQDVLSVSFRVTWNGSTPRMTDVVLEGPARRVFDGTISWPMKGAR